MEIEKPVEENIEQKNTLNNEINNVQGEDIGEKQKNFLETSLGKVINTGCDIALRNKNSNRFSNKYRKECHWNIYRKI